MRTVCLIYILFILLIINVFKSIGVFDEEIKYYTNYIAMDLFGSISSIIVDKKMEEDNKNE